MSELALTLAKYQWRNIMKEFMLLIFNKIDHQSGWPAERHRQFRKSCENYISKLKNSGNLKAAQPLLREGVTIFGSNGNWKEVPFDGRNEVQVGYFHILASDIREAIEIAKGNPEFEYGIAARIEVRPIKVKEESANFLYPGD